MWGKTRSSRGGSDFIVLDSTGLRYDSTFYSGEDSLEYYSQLSPAQRIQGKIIFEISDNLPEYKIVYEFGNPFIQTQLAAWNVSVDQDSKTDDVLVNVRSTEIISYQVYYQETTELKGYMFEYPSSFNEFLKIDVEVINTSTDPMSVTAEIFSIITAPYGNLSKATPYMGEGGLPEVTLAPNETVEGSVLFEISQSIDEASLYFIPTSKVIMSWDADMLSRNSVNSFELPLGEFAYVDNVGVVVYETDRRTSYSYYSDRIERASQDKIFIIADIEVVNVGMEQEFTGGVDFSAADSTGLRYDPALYLGDDRLNSTSLFPGQRIQGKVLFEVEADSPGVQVIYENSYPTILISWVDK